MLPKGEFWVDNYLLIYWVWKKKKSNRRRSLPVNSPKNCKPEEARTRFYNEPQQAMNTFVLYAEHFLHIKRIWNKLHILQA